MKGRVSIKKYRKGTTKGDGEDFFRFLLTEKLFAIFLFRRKKINEIKKKACNDSEVTSQKMFQFTRLWRMSIKEKLIFEIISFVS